MQIWTRPSISKLSYSVALALVSSGIFAQDNTLDSIVVTADRAQSALRDIPASVFSVGGDSLERVRHTHIAELLVRVPGTTISPTNGQDSLTAIRSPVLTGAGSCGAFQMAQDGIPLRATGFCNVNEIFEANSELASSIEVIRGPGSVLYGANAQHGAINVISQLISDSAFSDVSYDFGSNQYNRVRFTHSDTAGDQGYLVSFVGNSSDGYKHDSGHDQQKLNLKHSYSSGDFSVVSSFFVTNLNQETSGPVQGDDAYKDQDLKRFNPNPEAYKDARTYRLSSKFSWETEHGMFTLNPYYRDIDVAFLQHFLPGIPLEENGQNSYGLQSMYVSAPGSMFDWRVGVDMEITEGFLKETQASPTVGSAFLVNTIPVGKHYDYEVDATFVSPYMLLKYNFTDMDQLSLGVRYESVEYDYNNLMINGRTKDDGTACASGGCRFNRPADRTDNYENVSVQLGWIHDIDDNQQVYASVASAFRAPDTSEVYRLQNGQNVADLKSEEMDSYEIGYRATRNTLSYAIAAYYMDKDNAIFQDSNRNNISGAATLHRGVEFNISTKLTDVLQLSVATAYARHTYNDDLNGLKGLEIDTAPRVTGSAQLRWDIGNSRSMELEWVHMGKYYTDETNTQEYGGHNLVNLRYEAELNSNWYYAARITNLFNTDYAERADFAFGNERYWVGEPISAYLTVGTRF